MAYFLTDSKTGKKFSVMKVSNVKYQGYHVLSCKVDVPPYPDIYPMPDFIAATHGSGTHTTVIDLVEGGTLTISPVVPNRPNELRLILSRNGNSITTNIVDFQEVPPIPGEYSRYYNNVFAFSDTGGTMAILMGPSDGRTNRNDFVYQAGDIIWCKGNAPSNYNKRGEGTYSNSNIIPNIPETEIWPGKPSGGGGGGGDFDKTSNNIDYPDTPALSATDAGFISLYVPTKSQMHELSSYMWSNDFNLDQFKKIFADPMDIIIGLNIIPTTVQAGTTEHIKIGLIDTGIAMYKAAEQYVSVDCGSVSVSEYWGSALDYSPYTKISIYLPYIGTRELKTDDVMGKTISVKYNIDILSGACAVMIKCGDSILYEFAGSCGSPIPLTSVNWTNTVTAAIQLAAAGIGVAAGAAGAAAGAAGAEGSGLTAVQGANLVSSTAGSVMSAKPNIQRSGAVSGSAGMLGVQIPYLIIERPRQSLAGDYNKYVGYPSNITVKLSDLSGYTEVESIHLDGFNATDAEIKEMYSLLREGVIL